MQSRTSLVHGTNVDEAYGLIHVGCFGSVLTICVSRKGQQVSMTAFRQTLFGEPERAAGTLTEADWNRPAFGRFRNSISSRVSTGGHGQSRVETASGIIHPSAGAHRRELFTI
jgi:hypothetical protein